MNRDRCCPASPAARAPLGVGVALLAALLLAPPPACPGEASRGPAAVPPRLAPPVEDGPWLRPKQGEAAEPVWGVKGGIAVGLWPTGGPRGLLRIYAPYLGQPRLRMINFIAVEPIVGTIRGYSELEPSALDRTAGKAMWAGNDREDDPRPASPWRPPPGKVTGTGRSQALTFFVFVEPFKNGARPVVQVILRRDRPREVSFKVFAARGSATLRSCVLTATMGNYARLRRLWLKGEVVDAAKVWPDFRPDAWGFAPPRTWPLGRLRVAGGEAVVAATPDERDPAGAADARDVPRGWRYQGRPATQYWRAPARAGLVVRVNARKTYWATKAAIPGGVSYENFELEVPFRAGQAFTFGVTPEAPEKLGFPAAGRGAVRAAPTGGAARPALEIGP
jgi:hypothetical protein